ncbi:MAG: phosphatidyl-myo-inositol dimannoside synthase [Alphaproteobacteria bacterium]|jgi:phosphatidylinositol alpha-1,6-mannosyltransferase|nr:phosphatidyl-myo-inositol dimannoside synthase [Alphaproteobacteria bacterium]
MNVLALVTDAFGGFGGIAQYNRALLTALAQCVDRGHIVVLPRFGQADRSELPPAVRQLKARGSKLGYSIGAFCAAVAEGPFDVVFCGHLHMAPLGAIIARFLRVPLWLQLHGIEAWNSITRTQRWAAEHASLITSVSRHTRRRFLRFDGGDPARVRVLPNVVDNRFAAGPRPAHLLERHHLRGKRILLTVGRLAADERRKGHDTVIRALPAIIKACPDLVYLIAGKGDDETRLAALAQQHGVENEVLFVGMVEQDELADYYRLADVFVMPSTQEGFGIVFLEAAASGLKVIGGNGDGSSDALADGVIGFTIDPANSDELILAISQALAGHGPDPAQVQRFNRENFTRQVCELTSSHLLCPAARGTA